MGYPMFIHLQYLYIAGHCGHSSSLAIHPARPIGCTPLGLLACSPAVLLHLPCVTQGWQATNQDQLYTQLQWPSLLEIVFFSTFVSMDLHEDSPMEQAGAETLWAFPNAHSLCGTLPERAWAITIISPISGQQCDNYHPFLVPSAPEHKISSWHHRFVQRLERHWQEVKQRVPSEPVALAVWEGKASIWGLSVADTDSRTELLKDCHRYAVETCKCSKAQKDAKWHGTEKNRVCKYIPCLSHIYLLRAKINNRHL